jgi:(p)ppGpp synthase/HD superfamily hydrolase
MQAIPSPVLTEKFIRAIEFATATHATQVRKDTAIPYVSHLLAVASLVLEHGGSEDAVVAALLHDAPEDQGGRAMLALIEARFGSRVARIVDGCTDIFDEPKPAYGPRKEAYVKHIADADLETCLVSAADKLHNARSILRDVRTLGEVLWTRFSGTPEQIGWYYGGLAAAFEKRLTDPHGKALVAELNAAVNEIELLSSRFGRGRALGRRRDSCPDCSATGLAA